MQQQSVLAGRAVPVHPQGHKATKLPEGSILTSSGIVDGELLVVEGDNQESVAGVLEHEAVAVNPVSAK